MSISKDKLNEISEKSAWMNIHVQDLIKFIGELQLENQMLNKQLKTALNKISEIKKDRLEAINASDPPY